MKIKVTGRITLKVPYSIEVDVASSHLEDAKRRFWALLDNGEFDDQIFDSAAENIGSADTEDTDTEKIEEVKP